MSLTKRLSRNTRKPEPKPNGYYQTEWINEAQPAKLGSFLAIDTEGTGLNHRKPFINALTGKPFEYAARPFAISTGEFDCHTRKIRTRLFESKFVNPYTRQVVWTPKVLNEFRALLRRYRYHRYVFHNALHDLEALATINIIIDPRDCDDTLPAAHVLDSSEAHGLKPLGIKYHDISDTDESILREQTKEARKIATQRGIPVAPDLEADYWLPKFIFGSNASLDSYATMDAKRTVLHWLLQFEQLRKLGLWRNYVREQRILVDTHRMMQQPIHLHCEVEDVYNRYESIRVSRESDLLTHLTHLPAKDSPPPEALDVRKFNIRSCPQIVKLLYVHWQLPVMGLTEKGNPSASWDCLDQLRDWLAHQKPANIRKLCNVKLAHSVTQTLDHILGYRDYSTACSYIKGYLERAIFNEENGLLCLYPRSNPWGPATTRFSTSDPNAQNVPADEDVPVRICFGPPPGKVWFSLDFNQLELRLTAKASGDPTLNKILAEGGDQHQITCDRINAMRKRYRLPPITRKIAKNINFAWTYGAKSRKRNGQPGKLALMAGVPADDFDLAMQTAFPGVVEFMAVTSALVRKQGFVETLFGYRLYVRENLNPWTGELDRADYAGTNYKIQGSAGDILKNTIIAINEYIDYHDLASECRILITIHDEIILETSVNFSEHHLRKLHSIAASAGDPIGCKTPCGIAIIRDHWSAPVKLNFSTAL